VLLESDEGLRRGLERYDIDRRHEFPQVRLLRAAFDRHDFFARELRQRRDTAVPPDHDSLARDERGQRERDHRFALPRVRQGRGEDVHSSLLQLRNPRRDRDLLDRRGDTDLPGYHVTQVDFVADDRARLRIHEAHRLICAQHTAHEVALVFDIRELVRVRQGSPGAAQGDTEEGEPFESRWHATGAHAVT
jgi:hypothetical protein